MATETAVVKVTAESSAKPGYKTTEFWLACVAQIMGSLMASGVIESGSSWDKVAGLIILALSSMGYSASRATTKKAAVK